MNDFAPGDLVMKVRGDPNCPDLCEDHKGSQGTGRIYRVQMVLNHPYWRLPGLVIDGLPHGSGAFGWCACAFRKIKDEPDDEALIERIKACRPIRERIEA